MTDGKTYDVTLDGTTKQVVVSDGKVASVNVNRLTVPVATETEIKLVSKDANGVVLDEYAYDLFIVKYKCRKLQTKNVGRCNYIL